MAKNGVVLRFSLLAGALYFAAIAVAHVSGAKIPGLYIYYNVPSQPYQDKIIAFLAFGWVALFYAGAVAPQIVSLVIASAVVALLGLIHINTSTDFAAIAGAPSIAPYWVQFALLFGYVSWLAFFAARAQRGRGDG